MHGFCEQQPVLVLHDEACAVVFDRPGQLEGGASVGVAAAIM
jgi:hypothetical protein